MRCNVSTTTVFTESFALTWSVASLNMSCDLLNRLRAANWIFSAIGVLTIDLFIATIFFIGTILS